MENTLENSSTMKKNNEYTLNEARKKGENIGLIEKKSSVYKDKKMFKFKKVPAVQLM